jgi:hypothetical protein
MRRYTIQTTELKYLKETEVTYNYKKLTQLERPEKWHQEESVLETTVKYR